MQHPEEGEIHAWLDGQLSEADGAALEQHVAHCDACRALVAEARGLVAASSRILSALDSVPSGVIPERSAARAPRRRWFDMTIARAAVALLAVGAGTFAITRTSDFSSPPAAVGVEALATPPAADVVTPQANQARADIAEQPPAPPAVAQGRAAFSDGRAAAPARVPPPAAPTEQREALAAAGPPAPVAALPEPTFATSRSEGTANRARTGAPPGAAAAAPSAAPSSVSLSGVVVTGAATGDRLERRMNDVAAKSAAEASTQAASRVPGCYRLDTQPERYLDLRQTGLQQRDSSRVLFLHTASAVERGRWSPLAGDSVVLDLSRTSLGVFIRGRVGDGMLSGLASDGRAIRGTLVPSCTAR